MLGKKSSSKVEHHADLCKEINDLYARKNHDYGDSFHQTFTEEGLAKAVRDGRQRYCLAMHS